MVRTQSGNVTLSICFENATWTAAFLFAFPAFFGFLTPIRNFNSFKENYSFFRAYSHYLTVECGMDTTSGSQHSNRTKCHWHKGILHGPKSTKYNITSL
jgi:hypothetical protein